MEEIKISESPEAYVSSGDKGCGAPGSKEWNIAQIKQAETKQHIFEIVKEVIAKTTKKRGRKIADFKLIAIDFIERCFDGNG